ncbi:MAG: hypothetical protein HOO19_04835 [Rhodospirillaceae bacterium]|jgi:hypothetical protein|nr:hypothetical protein [Rhodospirillaceae bacterium]MBT3884874.1 hypothetical protein [Rhodospirillaceae bacterium]MBT4115815.1 hypothetical protein [Rhodospirillaceae bacterium]MBT4673223.1 hypothetical protein [Rhodospirillaceae bacterium]MBT4719062.1 hypothetical protein [Rhodospirillaceae bacterium]
MNTETVAIRPEPFWRVAGLDFRNLIWVFIALGVLVGVILYEEQWPLRFVHVASGVLLTGFDILMGFVIGPVVRRLDFEGRRAFSLNLLPKTLFILTPLGIIAPTSGWYLAVQTGYLEFGFPQFWWVVAALGVSFILAIQGLFILLPANLRIYLEMRKDEPRVEMVGRIMRRYFYTIASQGVMQLLIVVIMVKFATGL